MELDLHRVEYNLRFQPDIDIVSDYNSRLKELTNIASEWEINNDIYLGMDKNPYKRIEFNPMRFWYQCWSRNDDRAVSDIDQIFAHIPLDNSILCMIRYQYALNIGTVELPVIVDMLKTAFTPDQAYADILPEGESCDFTLISGSMLNDVSRLIFSIKVYNKINFMRHAGYNNMTSVTHENLGEFHQLASSLPEYNVLVSFEHVSVPTVDGDFIPSVTDCRDEASNSIKAAADKLLEMLKV